MERIRCAGRECGIESCIKQLDVLDGTNEKLAALYVRYISGGMSWEAYKAAQEKIVREALVNK